MRRTCELRGSTEVGDLGGSGRATGGFSLVEIMLGLTVIAIAIVGTVGSITSSAVLGDSNRETTIAYQAAQRVLEELHASEFGQVLALYNGVPGDDPGGAGTAPGPSFAVPGLDVRPDDADGFVGRVLLPTTGSPPRLLENVVNPDFGLPRDLNGDGAEDGADHSTDYIVLPVRVRVEWTGLSGERVIEVETVLSAR